MKKALLIGLFAVIFPTMALAATHRRELVTHAPPVPAPKANAICFNFGHDTLTSAAGVTQQLETLLKYSDCIRLAYAGFNNPLSESDALLAKSMGIRVTIGGDWYEHGSGEITSTDLPTYTSQVIQQAKWAQKNGIPQMSLGNEQESSLSGLSVCQWYSYLQSLSTQVRAVYGGEISYEMNSQYLSQYTGCGGAGLIVYGLNLYGGYAYNATTLQKAIDAFGASHVYVSETNCDVADVAACRGDAYHANEVANDADLLVKNFPHTPIYYFTWSANGNDGVQSFWGLYNGLILEQPLTLNSLSRTI